MSLSQAVKKTLHYAAFFNYPLSLKQTHHWLISPKIHPLKEVKRHCPKLKNTNKAASYLNLRLRKTRLRNSQIKINLAKQATKLIQILPTVKLVAITGSVAAQNAKSQDDLDLMIITSPNTLWLTRLLIVPLISLFFSRRQPDQSIKTSLKKHPSPICLNLWLDQTALKIPPKKQTLYTAHEILQAQPTLNRNNSYFQFVKANSWTKKYLANAYHLTLKNNPPSNPSPGQKSFPPTLKLFLQKIIILLNKLAFQFQFTYMKTKITTETISLHSAYFHPRNLSLKINAYLNQS